MSGTRLNEKLGKAIPLPVADKASYGVSLSAKVNIGDVLRAHQFIAHYQEDVVVCRPKMKRALFVT